MKTKSSISSKIFWPVAGMLTIIATGLRFAHWPSIFSSDASRVVLPGTDTYYHVYRAEKLVEGFPSLFLFDPSISHPHGAMVAWPPGFDLLVALPGLFTGSTEWLAAWGAVLPPVLGALGVLLLMLLTREILGPVCALAAGAWLCCMFDALTISAVGRIDHHCLVAPVFLAAFYFSVKSTQDTTPKMRFVWASACALSVAYAVMSIPISPPFFFLPIPLSLAILRVLNPKSILPAESITKGINLCLLLTCATVTIAVLSAGVVQYKLFDLYLPSLFTISVFGLISLGAWLIRLPVKRQLLVLFTTLSALVLLSIFFPVLTDPIREALTIASGKDASYAMADEASGLFYQGEIFSLGGAISRYSYLILMSPVLWLGLSIRIMKRKPPQFAKILLSVYILISMILLFVQARFAEYAAPALAILYSWAMIEVIGVLKNLSAIPGAKRRTRLYTGALCMLTLLAVSPMYTSLQTYLSRDPVARQRGLLEFIGQIKPLLVQNQDAAYGALCSWMDAHPLLYKTRYPVMVSSFGTEQATRMNQEGFQILLSEHEAEAVDALRKNRIRYLLVSTIHRKINEMAAMADLGRQYMEVRTEETEDMYARFYQPKQEFYRCLHTKLFLGDGAGDNTPSEQLEPLKHFRLLADSTGSNHLFERILPTYRLFEFVPGAKIKGIARPNINMYCTLPITTNTKRTIRYRQVTQTDPSGHYVFVVPYPTASTDAPVGSNQPYEITAEDRPLISSKVHVNRSQVYSGALIEMPPLAKQ